MRVIIAGSRQGVTYQDVRRAATQFQQLNESITTVLSGTAEGADKLGERWAEEREIPIERYPADWHLYKGRAGRVRNAKMATLAEGLIALWDGRSPGTAHMIEVATLRGLKVHVYPTCIGESVDVLSIQV